MRTYEAYAPVACAVPHCGTTAPQDDMYAITPTRTAYTEVPVCRSCLQLAKNRGALTMSLSLARKVIHKHTVMKERMAFFDQFVVTEPEQ